MKKVKKIQLKESELIDLIEKLVKENLGNGNGQNLGMMNTPTAKYKDLVEDEDVEGIDELEEEELDDEGGDMVDPKTGEVVKTESRKIPKKTLKLTESDLIRVIKNVVKEQNK
jgi:hypothetical protein|tara:strand:+ start:378 stop:716 length:339 start_codon:yes stop_codon:yes gene_type:complete